MYNKKIITVMMQWDYCKPERGVSGDKLCIFDNLAKITSSIIPFWFDSYLENKSELQKKLIRLADETRPDLIFFMTFTDQFTFETLDYLKNKYTTFAWFGDDQWRFENYTSKYAPHYSFVSTTDPCSVFKYRQLGIEPIMTQWAAQQYSDNIGPLQGNETYIYDISFIGGYNPYREWFLKFLRKQGIKVECFGAGWPNGRVSFEQMEQIFRKSKINLNLSNSVNPDLRFVFSSLRSAVHYLKSSKRVEQMKARNFEIPLAGGFQLTNYVSGLENYLQIGNEVAVYSQIEDCVQLIKNYLADDEARRRICEAGFKRTVTEHTYLHRMDKILLGIWDTPHLYQRHK